MPAPAWIDNFNRAMTQALINADYTITSWIPPYSRKDGDVLTHMRGCTIDSVARVDQEVESVGVFDTFNPDRSEPQGFVEAVFTCACGRFRDKSLRQEGTVTEFIHMIANPVN